MEPITMGILALIGAITSITTSAVQNSYNAKQQQQANEANIELTKLANESSLQNVQAQNEFNAAEAQKARDFELMMSNTQYQRSMADLQAAGLNPILAASNGASYNAPASASGSVAAVKQAHVDPKSVDFSGISSALSSMTTLMLISNLIPGIKNKIHDYKLNSQWQEL